VQIREQQKESWNKFSPGWKKWDNLFMDFLEPMGEEIIRSLNLRDSDIVLDIAAGTGEPGLTIASKLKRGKVVITDLAADMLTIAKENAERRNISNVEFLACDVCELPFVNESFNAISCRLGFMFFPDMQMAANEMARVLKPGGRVATSVWNVPEKNFWITAVMSAINKNIELPAPVPGAPGMFRCAKESVVPGLFQQAGLKNISITEVTGKLNCKTADVYWSVMTELAAPVVAALAKADELTQSKIRREVMEAIQQKYPDGNVMIDSSAFVITAEK
jgi:ubiquinone/menaquinone biosynthesis C-methylase UbiE